MRPRKAIISFPLNTDLTLVQLKTRLIMWREVFRRHIEVANSFWVVENSTCKNSKSLDKKKSVSIEETSKRLIFFIVNDSQPFSKPKYSFCYSEFHTWCIPYKWAIPDVLADPSYIKLWRNSRVLFDIVEARRWDEKIRKLRFFQFCIFSYIVFALQAIPHRLSL